MSKKGEWRFEVSLIYLYLINGCGRMLGERGSMWYNAFCAKYGEDEANYVLVEERVQCGGNTCIAIECGVVC